MYRTKVTKWLTKQWLSDHLFVHLLQMCKCTRVNTRPKVPLASCNHPFLSYLSHPATSCPPWLRVFSAKYTTTEGSSPPGCFPEFAHIQVKPSSKFVTTLGDLPPQPLKLVHTPSSQSSGFSLVWKQSPSPIEVALLKGFQQGSSKLNGEKSC